MRTLARVSHVFLRAYATVCTVPAPSNAQPAWGWMVLGLLADGMSGSGHYAARTASFPGASAAASAPRSV
jgi:hypothetical protein